MNRTIPEGPPPPTLDPDGPRVVAIGGGHGLARSLGAIRRYAGRCTAVVSVADDGGSSGRLRADLGLPAPGDLRLCLGALLPEPSPLGRGLEYRFPEGELAGHAFGNLLVAALAATTGDFLTGLAEAGRLLRILGPVLPATTVPVVLCAEANGELLEGQVNIMGASGIERVFLDPVDPPALKVALEEIEEADQIVIGPGSLYTSVLAALAGRSLRDAVAAARGRRIYVANLHDQVPEAAGYGVGRHVEAIVAHGVVPDLVVADPVTTSLGRVPAGIEVLLTPLAGRSGLVHDEVLLARALAGLGPVHEAMPASVVAPGDRAERD